MDDKLRWEPSWQEIIVDLEPADTVRINHTNCEAGEDTRKRLYFTRPASGGDKVLGYCHNCQKGNSFIASTGMYRVPSTMDETAEPHEGDEFSIPVLDDDIASWPADARQWLYQYGITDQWIKMYGICYIPSTHRMYLPIYNTIGGKLGYDRYKGYQTRRLWRHGRTSKYSTHLMDKHMTMDSLLVSKDKIASHSVIVEDYLSGIKILQWAKKEDLSVEALVNYGTKINVEAMNRLSGEEIFVWLDNDNSHVINQARKMARTCSLIKKQPIRTVLHKSDPKKQSLATITEVLCGHS